MRMKLSGFSREYDYPRSAAPGGDAVLSGSAQGVDLPAPLNAYTLKRAIPSARGGVTAPSPHRSAWQSRNINREAIAIALRLRLRTRLTPG